MSIKSSLKNVYFSTICRLALERSSTSEGAIETITNLIDEYGSGQVGEAGSAFAFVICDPNSAWILNIVGKLYAAEKINDQFRCITGLTIETKIDKCSKNLEDECKALSLWDGSVSIFICIITSKQSIEGDLLFLFRMNLILNTYSIQTINN